jgi:hypothetical protein
VIRPPFTPNAKALFLGAGAAAVGGAVAAAVACIPDLPDVASAGDGGADADVFSLDAGGEAVIPAGCGDGIIDLAAGEQCDPGPAGRGSTVFGCSPDCTMQCPAGAGFLWPKNNHCYELAAASASSLTLGADRGVCGALPGALPGYVHVATFASEEEFTAVATNVDAGWFWVGLAETKDDDDYVAYGVDFEPGWSTPCTGCYAHNPNPMAGLPLGNVMGSGAAYCVQASSDLHQKAWEKIPCGGLDPGIHVVCEREPVGSYAWQCDAGTCLDVVWTHGKKTYVYGLVPLSADAAEQTCRALGGRLVVLGSRDEREQLSKAIGKVGIPMSKVWIGLAQPTTTGAADSGDAAIGADAGGPTSTDWIWDDDASLDAYPPPWGWARPQTNGITSTRAFLTYEEPPQSDDSLARNDAPMLPALPYVCEVPVADAGALAAGDQ